LEYVFLGIVDVIARSFDQVLSAGLKLFLGLMNFMEGALRGPLQAIGIHGSLQTLILMMIPILTIVAAVKLFGGIVRAVFVIVLLLVLIHVTWPLVVGAPQVPG
jgi:hypothetical protein